MVDIDPSAQTERQFCSCESKGKKLLLSFYRSCVNPHILFQKIMEIFPQKYKIM